MDCSETTKTPLDIKNMTEDQGGIEVLPTPSDATNLTLEAIVSPSAPSVDGGSWVMAVQVAAILIVVVTLVAMTSVWAVKEIWRKNRYL